MHHVSLTVLASLMEIVVEHGLDIECGMTRRHAQDADVLLYHHDVSVLIDDLDISTLESIVILLRLAHRHLHARTQGIVELGDSLAIHLDATPLEGLLDLRLALALDVGEQPLQQGSWLSDRIMVVLMLLMIIVVLWSHDSAKVVFFALTAKYIARFIAISACFLL